MVDRQSPAPAPRNEAEGDLELDGSILIFALEKARLKPPRSSTVRHSDPVQPSLRQGHNRRRPSRQSL